MIALRRSGGLRPPRLHEVLEIALARPLDKQKDVAEKGERSRASRKATSRPGMA